MGPLKRMCCLGLLVMASLVATGCTPSSQAPDDDTDTGGVQTWRVPQDGATISEVLAKAGPDDTVVVSPGTYREAVVIDQPGIRLLGTDRNRVIIDGEVLRANAVVVTAPRVTVANLTVRNALLNGLLVTGMSDENGGLARGSDSYDRLDPEKFPPLQGFHITHVTSHNNGLYGIYAFNSQHGVIENSYASGGADSGIYVGQCKPCNIVVRNNIMEHNAVGYEHTNAGPDVFIVGNRMSENRVGVTINSNHAEAFLPQQAATVAGNAVVDNDFAATPEQGNGAFGIGIGIGGGTENLIRANRVSGHSGIGIALASVDDLPVLDNTVSNNVLADNRLDIALSSTERSADSGNCLDGNRASTYRPPGLQDELACPSGKSGFGVDVLLPRMRNPRGIAFTDVIPPTAQPSLSDPAQSVPTWSIDRVPTIEVSALTPPPPTLLTAAKDALPPIA